MKSHFRAEMALCVPVSLSIPTGKVFRRRISIFARLAIILNDIGRSLEMARWNVLDLGFQEPQARAQENKMRTIGVQRRAACFQRFAPCRRSENRRHSANRRKHAARRWAPRARIIFSRALAYGSENPRSRFLQRAISKLRLISLSTITSRAKMGILRRNTFSA